MDPRSALRSVFTQYVGFAGRARRSEFWWFALFGFVVNVVTSSIDRASGSGAVGDLVSLALLLPSLALWSRRLHDSGRSAWWLLLALTGIGIIVLIVFACLDSQRGTNQHGPSPKYADAAPAYGQPPAPYRA